MSLPDVTVASLNFPQVGEVSPTRWSYRVVTV
jgi:hypothetical protein